MISSLRAEISSSKSETLEVSLNEELVNSLRYELEFLQNETYNNSFQLSVKTKDIKSINMSIFNPPLHSYYCLVFFSILTFCTVFPIFSQN